MELAGVADDAAVDGVAGSSLAYLLAPADDAETPWSKGGSSSYGVGANSGATKDTGQYDRRLSGSSASTPGSGYRSGSSTAGGGGSGSGYHRDLSSDRKYGSQLDSPAGRDHSSTRTGSYSDTKYGTYPHRSRADASHGPPVTLPPTPSSGRRSRDPSPSTEAPAGGSSLPLQLQLRMLSHRPSYSRSTSRESAPTSPSTSTSSPGSSRFSSATLPRSPHADKPAPVFGRTDDSASTDRERTSSYTPYSARSRNEERSPYLSSLLSSKSDDRPSRAEERPSSSPYRPSLLGSSPSLGSTSARTRPEERSSYRTSNSTDSRALGPTASYLSHTNGPLRSRLDNSTTTTASREDKTNNTTTNKVQDGKAAEESSSEEEESESEESESESSEEEEAAKQKAGGPVRRRPSQTVFVTVVSRGTSPTPPSASPSPFLRSRRAELARVLERTVARPSAAARPRTQDCAVQSDRGDDTSRTSRFAGASRPSPWTSYLDRYSSSRYSSGSGSSRVGGYSLTSSSPRTSASPSSDSLASNATSAAKSPSAPSVSGDSAEDSAKDKDKEKAAAASSASAPSTPSSEAPSKGVTRAISFKSLPRTRASPDSKDESGASSPSGSAPASAAEAGKPPALSRAASSRNVSSIIGRLQRSDSDLSTRSKSSSATSLSEKTPAPPPATPEAAPSAPHSRAATTHDSESSRASAPADAAAAKTAPSETQAQTTRTRSPSASASSLTDAPRSKSGSASSLSDKADAAGKPPRAPSASAGSSAGSAASKPPPCPPPADLARSKSTLSATSLADRQTGAAGADKPPPAPPPPPPPGPQGPLSRSQSSGTAGAGHSRKLPPVAPRAGNKDFRKSALNVDLEAAVRRKLRSGSDGAIADAPPAPAGAEARLSASSSAPKVLVTAPTAPSARGTGQHPASTSASASESSSSSSSSETESSETESSTESESEQEPVEKPADREEAKSFLMRALAPVTNFFRGSGEAAPDKDKDKEKLARHIRHVQSGERAWWLDPNAEVPEGVTRIASSHQLAGAGVSRAPSAAQVAAGGGLSRAPSSRKLAALQRAPSSQRVGPGFRIRPQQSGELPWWLCKDAEVPEGVVKLETSSSDEEDHSKADSGRRSPYDNVPDTEPEPGVGPEVEAAQQTGGTARRRSRGFIGSHTNIDDILGSVASLVEPAMGVARLRRRQMGLAAEDDDEDAQDVEEVDAASVRLHDSSAQRPTIVRRRSQPSDGPASARDGMIKLDDAALQLYKDGDYGAYLDLDASINEQQDEFENFHKNHKNSIVLRTQLSVRVHTIIEKLLNSEGRELRRALFSLKQIFQEDKDLVHEFVQNDGLACLIKVGSEADQNYQNYILRALGQVMLYVDGMNGVMEHNQTVQWLYTLIASKFRLVVKTALKLLLVFVEYVETNCLLLIRAIHTVDSSHGALPWSNIIKLLKDFDTADTELLIYATTLINKTLNGIPDQDTYYDQVDALEEQGIEAVIQRYMSKQGTDLDLLRQFQIYEAVLHHEDGEEKGTPLKQLDDAIRKTLRQRKALTESVPATGRRKSRRHSTGTSPFSVRQQQQQSPSSNQLLVPGQDEEGSPGSRTPPGYGDSSHKDRKNQKSVASGHEMEGTAQTPDSPKRESGSVRDLTQRLANAGVGGNQDEVTGPRPPDLAGDMTGLVSRAKEGLAKSKSKAEVVPSPRPPPEVKKSEVDLQWEELVNKVKRPLALADLDFTDLVSDDDTDLLSPSPICNGGPPPPPPAPRGVAPPPPPALRGVGPPPPPPAAIPPAMRNGLSPRTTALSNSPTSPPIRKTKKTVKLFWKEVRDDPVVAAKLHSVGGTIWDELPSVAVDTQKLEHLFESRAKDLIAKKQQEMNKNKEIIVLDHKRSNAINIGMTKLPPPRSIRTAIMKMDATIMNREGIEKLLTMLPTEEECTKIQEAQMANPDLPLGSAEQFLLTLASISELPARLKLWAFKLDYENSEKEVAEPLMDLKQGMETLKSNKTFRGILSTLLSIGIFLNGSEVKGFQIEYLAKVPEVKDTVHKHSLLHHLCHMVMEKFPDSTDLYSEIGAVTRASKVDFDELAANIQKMEQECKASWDHLKVIAKHDGFTMKTKMSDFLADCAERIIVLGIVHRRVMNRFHKFLLWLGIPMHRVQDLRPNEFCRTVSEFALEYRTTRERVLQQLEKKANHRERNKTRGKMITEVGKFRTKEDRADAELRQLLGGDVSDAESVHGTLTLPWRRQRKDAGRNALSPSTGDATVNGHLTDGDDEILESLVKTATKAPNTRTTPRERKRTRNADRKSLKRSRTRENNVMEGCRGSP
ncbi:uncharacterized protein LOC126267989 isoform X8 [Schistocerca gregaria]|uniref:uncharacterized protein LOC126267989 isoform X8 n=1 Tax=Schistocerca gregaria TaxID=7010 RepID=UPI00211DCF9E|nr:uncharacterized protein LOC126267989 isoform X8 [Schistocerca gregaria]